MKTYFYIAEVENEVEGSVEAESLEQAEKLARAHALKNYPCGYVSNITLEDGEDD